MVVLPIDAVLLAAPGLWMPEQARAHVVTAVLGLVLLTGGTRYRARLHLSVLDELPVLVGRLAVAAAVVATAIALRHEQEAVAVYLVDAMIAIALVVLGRVVTGRLVSLGRSRRISRQATRLPARAWGSRAPRSRFPSTREPITRSASPARMGAISSGSSSGWSE